MSVPARARAAAGDQAARWSARTLLVAAAIALIAGVFWYARAATVPLIIAALIATQLLPLIDWLTRRKVPRGLAVAASLIAVVLIAAGLTWLFADSLFGQLNGIGAEISDGVDEALAWLRDNNAWVQEHEDGIRNFLSGILPAAKDAAEGLAGSLLGGLALAAQLIGSALLSLVFLLYLLTDGGAVWRWIQGRFSLDRQEQVGVAGVAAWGAATGYIRGIALVALIDTTVIGIGMLIIGTPLAGTLMLLTFVSLFIPILGAWVSGVIIVLVTLGEQGSGAALAMAVVILVAQQLDSMFVTPLVYKQTVNLHPIVTLTVVIVGTQLMGIIGAFLAVPAVAVGWAIYNSLQSPEQAPDTADAAHAAPAG